MTIKTSNCKMIRG